MSSFGSTSFNRWAALGVVATLVLAACDGGKEPDLGLPKTKKFSDLKQENKNELSKEELEEARRQAGFKSPEEERAEALARYATEEKAYVKGRLAAYRKLVTKLRGQIDAFEKAAPKWASAKNPEGTVAKFKEKYTKDTKALRDEYNTLTETGSRGGDTTSALALALEDWETLGEELGPNIAEAEGFTTALQGLRTKLDALLSTLTEIEKDESIEPDPPTDGKQ